MGASPSYCMHACALLPQSILFYNSCVRPTFAIQEDTFSFRSAIVQPFKYVVILIFLMHCMACVLELASNLAWNERFTYAFFAQHRPTRIPQSLFLYYVYLLIIFSCCPGGRMATSMTNQLQRQWPSICRLCTGHVWRSQPLDMVISYQKTCLKNGPLRRSCSW